MSTVSTVFVVLPTGKADLIETEKLERTLKFFLARREISHTSRSYWNDGEYETEYGVRLDLDPALCDDHFVQLLGGIVYVTAQLYGEIRIQLG
jgi:hypothetical protein